MLTHTLSTQLPSIIKQKNEIDGGKKRIRKKKRNEKIGEKRVLNLFGEKRPSHARYMVGVGVMTNSSEKNQSRT